MRQIEDIREKRRMGWNFCEIMEDLLRNSEGLLKEYGNPFEILSKSGIKLEEGKADEWLDITRESWRSLRVEKQIEYATMYQKWYANTHNNGVKEKTFSTGDVNIEYLLVPPGKFEGGVSGIIKKAFWIAKYEVTQKQWNDSGVSGEEDPIFDGNNRPRENVNWTESNNFCSQVGGKLPSEKQWEYACRAGTTTKFSFGDDEDNLDRYAWYEGNNDTETKNVGTREPNGWGIYDMHGNVWEWCEDWYISGSDRVIRGGCWSDSSINCASAIRDKLYPMFRGEVLGFRPVRPYP